MAANRVFFPQDALEIWMANGRASVANDRMLLDGVAFALETGLHFTSEVTGEPDAAELVGRCKTLEQIEALGGEHYADSVVLNDNAYQVVEGFLARLEGAPPPGNDPPAALLALFTQE